MSCFRLFGIAVWLFTQETPFIDALEEEDESLDEVDNIASQFHFSKVESCM